MKRGRQVEREIKEETGRRIETDKERETVS